MLATATMKLPTLVKYPYLIHLNDFIRMYFGEGKRLEHVLIPTYVERALERIKKYLRNESYTHTAREDLEVISFYLGLMLTSSVDPWALSKFIDYESKITRRFLQVDDEYTVCKVAKRVGLSLEYLGSRSNRCGKAIVIGIDPRSGRKIIECYPFRVKIPHYLIGTEKLCTDPKWKLTNKYVLHGYVYLVKNDVTRIVEEFVKNYLRELANNLSIDLIVVNEVVGKDVKGELISIIKEVRGFTSEEIVKEYRRLKGIIVEEAFPPCILKIKELAEKGEHLTHHQRFALATFLLNIGMDIEDVLNIFRNLPDFNERIAKYQVEHLAGVRGGRKKYLVYSCDKMRTLGLCVSECGVKNPLAYYWRTLRKSKEYIKSLRKNNEDNK